MLKKVYTQLSNLDCFLIGAIKPFIGILHSMYSICEIRLIFYSRLFQGHLFVAEYCGLYMTYQIWSDLQVKGAFKKLHCQ